MKVQDAVGHVYSIAPGSPFLATLIDALIDGRLVEGFSLDDPAALARVLVYVPTRRTADALTSAFTQRLAGRGWPSIILPRIQVIGDVDEDLLPLTVAAGRDDGFWSLPIAMDGVRRRLTMTALVHQWARAYARAALGLDQGAMLHVSATPTDAAYLAIDLLALIDAVHRERSNWSLLEDLVPDDYGAFWQMSLEFLKIATDFWPAHLKELGLVDPVERRNQVLAREVDAIAAHDGPVIAAGSTGSIPATADLLAAVARHPSGALILPGLDVHLDEPSWQALGQLHPKPGEGEPVAGHPQFNLKQLLDLLKISREDVTNLSDLAPPLLLRERLISEALRPAETTDQWVDRLASIPPEARAEALSGVAMAEAQNEQEEARIAALALREALVEPDKRAALVTPDRALARRVVTELKRWEIKVEDTAGMPLAETPPVLLMRLMVECLVEQFDAVRLLALLKHPLASFGLPRAEVRRAARFLEINFLRGPKLGAGLAPLKDEVTRCHRALEEDPRKDKDGNILPIPDVWDEAIGLLGHVETALTPLAGMMEEGDDGQPFELWLAATIAALEAVALGADGTSSRLYDEEAGRSLQAFFDRASGGSPEGTAALDVSLNVVLGARDLPAFLVALMSGETVLAHGAGTARLQLLGTLEARLLDVDRVVIGGLNESSWPTETTSDAWLSRPMRAGMRLEPPERRIGLAAHDFAQAMGRAEVVLIRAIKTGGEVTVPSRWMQRLQAVAGEEASAAMAARGRLYEGWAARLDAPKRDTPFERPAPTPPLHLRPRSLSVTEIETWVRDPYALYARHVLGLRPLDAIATPPGGAEKGSIIHEILGDFTQSWHGPYDDEALAALIALGRDAFAKFDNFPDLLAFWWPRFERIAHWFIFDWEAARDGDVASRFAEISGRITLEMPGGDFDLRGRADRLDIRSDDSLHIIDFKTGQPPSARQVLPGFAPQLALEGLMAKRGGFADIPASIEVGAMDWVQLSGGRVPGAVKNGVEKDYAAEDIVALIAERLYQLINAYDDVTKGYASRARPMFERFESSYDHLARVKEWSMQSGEES